MWEKFEKIKKTLTFVAKNKMLDSFLLILSIYCLVVNVTYTDEHI